MSSSTSSSRSWLRDCLSGSGSKRGAIPGGVATQRIAWVCLVVLCAAGIVRTGTQGLSHLARVPIWQVGAAEVLLVGSSHVRSGIDPSLFARPTGVLSFAGMNIELGAAVLRAHRDLWPKLETVIMEIDEFTLLLDAVKLREDDLTHLCDRLDLSVWELPGRADGFSRVRRSVTSIVRGDGWAALGPKHRLTLSRLRRHLIGPGRFFSEPEPTRSWAQTDSELTPERAVKRVRALQEHSVISANASERNVAALLRLARWLDREGIGLALVTLPKHHTYLSNRPPEWENMVRTGVRTVREGVDAWASETSRSFPVPYWDLERDPRFTDAAFGDQDHLNAVGAETLAPQLEALLAQNRTDEDGEPAT